MLFCDNHFTKYKTNHLSEDDYSNLQQAAIPH